MRCLVYGPQEVPQCPNLDKILWAKVSEGGKMRNDERCKWRQIQKLLDEIRRNRRPTRPGIGSIEVTYELREMDKLTPAERKVVLLQIEGYSYLNIAKKLEITENTVKTHMSRIFRKLGVNNSKEVIRKVLPFEKIPPKDSQ
jgi:DNA-binding CsgD family transcriptional regulator